MEILPLLVLPPPQKKKRDKGSPKFFSISTPSVIRQNERLGPKFSSLRKLTNATEPVALAPNSDGLYPDRAIVFELAQPKPEFKKAIEKLGLSWIDENDFTFQSDEDFHDKKKPEKILDGRLYLTVPNKEALNQLLRVWDLYSTKKELPKGQKDWKELFSHLKDVRPWGAKDRLTNETSNFLKALDPTSKEDIHLEFEAVFYNNPAKDAIVRKKIIAALESANALIVDEAIIPEIRYHAILASIDTSSAVRFLDLNSPILNTNEIAFIRPQAMSISNKNSEPDEEFEYEQAPPINRPPVAALFDGVVVQNHELLKDRLIIDDSEGLEQLSPVNTRSHGTAMASLIIHGDIAQNETAIESKLYIQFILSATQSKQLETTPNNRLILDVIYKAITRLKEAPPELGGDVFIINLSLGDINRPFSGQMSAWARLIDFLSWKYNLLFIISTGNILSPITLPNISKPNDITSLTPPQKNSLFIKALEEKIATRTIFSPAESINGLTVGASHSDGSEVLNNVYLVDPFDAPHFPSMISGMGLGYRQSVKPDILHCGGRALYSYSISPSGLALQPGIAGKYFGQEVAGTSSAGALTKSIGTSNSAALTTRTAIKIYESLEQQLSSSDFSKLKPFLPLVIKGLLAHSSSWGAAGNILDSILEPRNTKQWKSRRSNITRFLGYGTIAPERVTTCSENRVTMIGTGSLLEEGAEIFEFPLPTSISSRKDVRRLSITLSWISPTKPGEQAYKEALLDFRPENKDGYPIGVTRVSANQPPSDTSRKGTLIHEIFEGQDAIPIGDDDSLRVRVECRTQGFQTIPKIPYAIIITFEVASSLKANIYAEISEKLNIKNKVQSKVRP